MKNPMWVWVVLVSSCAQNPEIWVPRDQDFQPPRMVSCVREGEGVVLGFDKPIGELSVEPPRGEVTIEAQSESVRRLQFSVQPEPGEEWVLKVQAADVQGNSAQFLVAVYGINPRLPRVRINELNIQGSSTRPDFIELLVQSDGNLAGLVVALGKPADGEPFFTFPSVEVRAGDFVLLHAKPQGITQEKDERRNKRESGGLLSSPSAWDFWWRGGKGLSGTNGLVVLLDNPRGDARDAVVYTNRTSASDDRYDGWGSQAMKLRAEWVRALGIWPTVEEGKIVPEDGVPSGEVTATRTLNRRNTGTGKGAWFTGATGTSTPGAANTTQVHSP